MTPTEFTVASRVYQRDKTKSAAHRSLTKTPQDQATQLLHPFIISCTPQGFLEAEAASGLPERIWLHQRAFPPGWDLQL